MILQLEGRRREEIGLTVSCVVSGVICKIFQTNLLSTVCGRCFDPVTGEVSPNKGMESPCLSQFGMLCS